MRIIPHKSACLHFFTIWCCLLTHATPGGDPNAPPISDYFGSKRRYEDVNPYLAEDVLAVNRSILQPPSAQCREIYLTAIIRHGTRFPTTSSIKRMQQMYQLVLEKASGQESWLEEIQSHWRMWYTEDMDGRLVQKGEEDHKHLAVRLSKLFPELVSEEKLRGGLIQFITSSKHRCVSSIQAFKAGLTQLWGIQDVEFPHTENDSLMRFFERCSRLEREVLNNSSAVEEVTKFKVGPEMRRVQEKVANRLGMEHDLLTQDMAQAAFDLCAYEFTINAVNSPWCRLFDEDDAQVMEYAEDLNEYWKRGYGHEINSKSSCGLFHDTFQRLEKAANEYKSGRQVSEAVTVQVGHIPTLLPLLTLLGFFNHTQALTSTTYHAQTQRSFRIGQVLPYAANLVLVLHDCGEEQLRLQALLNERPVAFPGMAAQQGTMMPYGDVRERYRELLHGCDFEAECQLG